MPKCTINGKEIEVKEGTSIIQAMTENGQRIAHYCWHPGLSVAGVCRLCMVEIEGNPRVQIACNTMVTEGMKINNTSEKVKEAVKWGLDFHLINHPLDCPICDQAGECGLQDQYMEYGIYDSEMAERKVKKHKVVSLGDRIVLDSERCILCSRCVRFTDEVTGTKELGIFNRGDRSEIGTFEDRPLNNKYSINTVDICPVGALTSKDFRFKQRVWYLKDGDTICTGCSTGCNTKVYFNREGIFRIKPRFNKEVNGYWMCDEGRDLYKVFNRENRQIKALKKLGHSFEEMLPGAAAKDIFKNLSTSLQGASLVVTGQLSNEDLQKAFSFFTGALNSKQIYHWKNNPESWSDFDGLLLRGDKNPNTKGVEKCFEEFQIQTRFEDLEAALEQSQISTLVVMVPENIFAYPDLSAKLKHFGKVKNLILLSSSLVSLEDVRGGAHCWVVPMKTTIEKSGSFINHNGLTQFFKKVTTLVSEALTVDQALTLMGGGEVTVEMPHSSSETRFLVDYNHRSDQVKAEAYKKNEFSFKRGTL